MEKDQNDKIKNRAHKIVLYLQTEQNIEFLLLHMQHCFNHMQHTKISYFESKIRLKL